MFATRSRWTRDRHVRSVAAALVERGHRGWIVSRSRPVRCTMGPSALNAACRQPHPTVAAEHEHDLSLNAMVLLNGEFGLGPATSPASRPVLGDQPVPRRRCRSPPARIARPAADMIVHGDMVAVDEGAFDVVTACGVCARIMSRKALRLATRFDRLVVLNVIGRNEAIDRAESIGFSTSANIRVTRSRLACSRSGSQFGPWQLRPLIRSAHFSPT